MPFCYQLILCGYSSYGRYKTDWFELSTKRSAITMDLTLYALPVFLVGCICAPWELTVPAILLPTRATNGTAPPSDTRILSGEDLPVHDRAAPLRKFTSLAATDKHLRSAASHA